MPLPLALRPSRLARLQDAILSLQPTAYWPLDDGSGPLREIMGSHSLVTLATSADADDIVDTATPHGLVAGDAFTFTSLTGGSNVTAGTVYWVIAANLAAQTFQFATTAGGSAVDFGSDITAGTVRVPRKLFPATVTGTPLYGVAAPDPIGRGITWAAGGQYAKTSTSIGVPSSSVSVLALFSTTDATAASRTFVGRAAASQYSWFLGLTSGHKIAMTAYQSGNPTHASVSMSNPVANDGLWHLAMGTFDGTTVVVMMDGLARATSTSLTGSWHTASTAAVGIGVLNATGQMIGTLGPCAFWNDRVITDAERLWLNSIMRGG